MTSKIGARRLLSLSMSNLDQSIDAGLAEALMSNPEACAQYSAWNFCAYVWVETGDDHFTCEVWIGNAPIKTLRCPDLETIMAEASQEFG
jgi:hypothetical protein